MSVLNESVSIKIKQVSHMEWDKKTVKVAARPFHALAYRLKGRADFSDGRINAQTQKGDVFFVPAGCSYSASYSEKNEILVIHFESDLNSKMENYRINNQQIIENLFLKLYNMWKDNKESYWNKMSVFCEIIELINEEQNAERYNKTYEAFLNAVECINQNCLLDDFSVEKAILASHMSSKYFRKLFINKFGITPSKYIITKRLSYAEKLLCTGRYSIKEVAQMSGFADVKYFSRVVKKEYGVPPSKLYKHILY